MAFRTWGRLLLTALGVSLLAGAGQLGIAFGFGIVRLSGTFTGATVNQWPAQLVWAGWFAANAAVVGAVLTERLARRDGGLAGTGRLLAVASAAALGATVVAPLCMQPARAAELVSMDPVWAVGICAVLGALVGAGAAVAVLLQPPVGWNVAAIAGALWLLALVSVAPSLVSTGPLDTVRLGVLEPASLDAGAVQGLALVVLPLVALLAGAATGGLARWRGHPPLVSGATGVAGPALVAFAYLTAGPGDTADRYQLTPYYAALLAVALGALGSAAAALLRWPLVTRTAPTGAIEPTDILRPLPTGPALPQTPAPTGGGDEPETVDLAGATLVVADQAGGGTGSGAVTAAGGDGPAPRAVPPHWDWPADGGAVPAPAADVRAGAVPAWTTEPPASDPGNPPTVDRPREPEPTRTQDSADERAPGTSSAPGTPAPPFAAAAVAPTVPAAPAAPVAPLAPTVPTAPAAPVADEAPPAGKATPDAQPAGEVTAAARSTEGATTAAQQVGAAAPAGQPAGAATPTGQPAEEPTQPAEGSAPAGQPAEAVADQPVVPNAPKPRRTRKPRSTRQPAATAAPEGAGPVPVATGTPETGATAPGAAMSSPSPDASAAPDTTAGTTAPGTTTSPQPGAQAGTGPDTATGPAPGPAPDNTTGSEPGVTTEARSGVTTEATSGVTTEARSGVTTEATSGSTTEAGSGSTTGPEFGATADAAPGSAAVAGSGVPGSHDSGPRPVPLFAADGEAAPGRAVEPDAGTAPPPAPAWPVSPRPRADGAADAAQPATEPAPDPTPRPRHRAPMPDLARAANWEALATARRGGPVPAPVDAAPENGIPTARAEVPAPGSPAPAEAEQPTGRGRGRLGLFRRNRSRPEDAPADRGSEPLPAQDEEYVDWVTGLSKPVPDNEPEQESGRRSLRSTGRHHRD
ncbi:hypothetical protein RM555_05955 [Micromonospora sp. DSM 115977]|uniref:Uncharacterized protein n=1 Tax=Micromonospora reichwaldensis TaxID=3075516 RepID=A0ABU2WRJ7_9ACTN|nr:hypothetical protein [Micromonospora sp. DSM 115977]MDT0528539.1 hypothetical protein [Micromonospora sp. DSM 115977]